MLSRKTLDGRGRPGFAQRSVANATPGPRFALLLPSFTCVTPSRIWRMPSILQQMRRSKIRRASPENACFDSERQTPPRFSVPGAVAAAALQARSPFLSKREAR
ncbi:hypothetical protein MRX96_037336 [Rhipicephalus microplus]